MARPFFVLRFSFCVLLCGCGPFQLFRRPAPPPASVPDAPAPAVVQASFRESAPVRTPTAVLALSGGGSYGAFTAGVLNGWTKADTRPAFDVVTGVSTGALIAPLAFLGPRYDPALKQFYTEVGRKDVIGRRSYLTVPFRDAAFTNAPLRRLVDSALTDDVVKEIASEHGKGRRLYAATTRLDTRSTVVWDVGAIAAKGGADARRRIGDIMVASAAVPGAFPPQPIVVEEDGQKRTELHVDGGVTAPVFVPPAVLQAGGAGCDMYVIVAGKPLPDAEPVRPRVLKVLGASGIALLRAHTRREVSNLYHMAGGYGVRFHVANVPQDLTVTDSGFDFDTKDMNALYAAGVTVGLGGPAWRDRPAEVGPGADGIRTGEAVDKRP
jgi:predicted acylesterase/phospholipase RssA